jgi:hypothetical protein
MKELSREAILRMVGLHDAAHMVRQLNAIQLSLEEEQGKMVAYWTEIRKSEKEVTLLAGRVAENETDIGQLQVTAQQITASVSSLTTTVNGHTTSIGQLQITANSLTASVSSISDTVNGHTTKIAALEITDSGISNRVTVIEGDYVKNAQISLMVVKDGNGYISNALIDADDIDFVFTKAVSWYWQRKTEANKRMGLDSSGNLWINGEYRGGTIVNNVNVGTTGNKMQIYTDETISSQTGYKKSGIRGVNGSTTLLDLGFGDNNYPMLTLMAPARTGSPVTTHYPGFSTYHYGYYSADFGMASSGRVRIYAPLAAWPNRNQATIGEVFLDGEDLKVKID